MVDSTFDDESAATLAGEAAEPGHAGAAGGSGGPGVEFLPAGAKLGRYLVLDRLGVGAMGVVYAAYDPELDRKVAVKVLHDRKGGKGTQGAARLLREAQALAKLSHPNVVAVHDVGSVSNRVFVAMEFVLGETLEQWLGHGSPTLPQIIRVLSDAGRGLAAAHAAGLIHRDFKPANVMVREDGHILVMDFGVARSSDASAEPSEITDTAAGSVRSQVDSTIDLTRTGALLGTPAYMAPEQHSGTDVDARSDQFAFCVTLHEALYGQRPFQGDSLLALAYQVSHGKVRPAPPQSRVPARIRRVMLKGLSVDKEERYPSMEALLADLAKASRSRAPLVWGAAGVVGLAGALAAGPVLERNRVAACEARGQAVLATWGDAERETVRAAIAASDAGDADETVARLRPWLDDYVADIAALRTENCLDEEVRATRSPALIAAADDCLSERSDAFAVLVEELSNGNRDMSIRSVQAAVALPPVSNCAEDRKLITRAEIPESIRDGVAEARRQLFRAHILAEAGRYAESEKAVREVMARAEELGHAPLSAEVALALGHPLEEQANYEQAIESNERAFTLGIAEGQDEVAAKAAAALVHLTGVKLANAEEARRWESIAQSLLHRIGAEEDMLAGRVAMASGIVAFVAGDYDAAEASLESARSIFEDVLGPDHLSVAGTHNILGIIALVRGEFDASLAHHERALEIRTPVLGPMHPMIGQSYANIGNVHYSKDDYEKAVESYTRSLEINEHVFGLDHPSPATDLNNIGNAHDSMGDQAAALEAYDRSLAVRERAFGPEHPVVAQTLHNIAIVQRQLRKFDLAQKAIERTLAIKAKSEGEDHPSYGRALVELGRLRMDMDDPAAALEPLEKAVGIAERSQSAPSELAEAKYTLARALRRTTPDSARAIELAKAALALLPETEHDKLRTDIGEWLAK